MKTNHIGIRVRDIEASTKFYCDLLDFEFDHRFETPKLILVFLKNEDTKIELVYSKDGEYDYVRNGILEHFAFTVPDIYAHVEKLKNNNVNFISKNVIKFKDELIVFFEGPNGEKLELVQVDNVD